MFFPDSVAIILFALLLDAAMGDSSYFYRRFPHPVALMGYVITGLDKALNRASFQRAGGVVAIVILVCVSLAVGYALSHGLSPYNWGWLLEALLASAFIAQNSLYRHVHVVALALSVGDIEVARSSVAKIVGRDTANLDENGIARASIESLAENFSDAVVAPVFWGLLFGLPGIIAYKAINTADSMIGHRNERYENFGWAAARLDDLVNYLPARLSGLLLIIVALVKPGARAGVGFSAMMRDAGLHRSPNAGYPEAAMAGALDLKLAGPRIYDGQTIEDSWMGHGRAEATAPDIKAALRLFAFACVLQFLLIVPIQYWVMVH